MAVPEGERTLTQPYFVLEAQKLLIYTLNITKNKKIFTEEYFGALTSPIIESARKIYADAFMANGIYVGKSAEEYIERRDLQKRAIRECNFLLSQITVAQKVFHFKTKRLKYWGEMIIKVRNYLKAWRESDRKRYGYLLK